VIKEAEIALNSTVNKTTGETPYFLLHGFEPKLNSKNHKVNKSLENWLTDLVNLRIKAFQLMNENSIKNLIKKNKVRKHKNILYGDYVLIKQEIKGKLDERFIGPYKVVKVYESNVEVDIDGITKVIHKDKVKVTDPPDDEVIEKGEEMWEPEDEDTQLISLPEYNSNDEPLEQVLVDLPASDLSITIENIDLPLDINQDNDSSSYESVEDISTINLVMISSLYSQPLWRNIKQYPIRKWTDHANQSISTKSVASQSTFDRPTKC
jgi:hypothetical protein